MLPAKPQPLSKEKITGGNDDTEIAALNRSVLPDTNGIFNKPGCTEPRLHLGSNAGISGAGSVSGTFGERCDWHMRVRVIVGLAVAAREKHSQQMRRAASVFTDDESSVEVSHLPEDRYSLIGVFSIPTAAQDDLLDRIEQDLSNSLDDVTGPVVTAMSGTLDGA